MILEAAKLISILDDTGTHAGAKYSSCVGMVASAESWSHFDGKWRQVLREFKVDDFHAKRFYARDADGKRVSSFRGWDDLKAYDFMGTLMALLKPMPMRLIGAAIDAAAFAALADHERAFFTGQLLDPTTGKSYGTGAPCKPFILAFGIAVHRSLDFGNCQIPLGVVLDQNDQFAAQAATACREFSRLPRYFGLVRSCELMSRRDYPALHVADLAAYLWNRFLTKGKLTEEQAFAMDRISVKGSSIMKVTADVLDVLRELASDVLSVSLSGASS